MLSPKNVLYYIIMFFIIIINNNMKKCAKKGQQKRTDLARKYFDKMSGICRTNSLLVKT